MFYLEIIMNTIEGIRVIKAMTTKPNDGLKAHTVREAIGCHSGFIIHNGFIIYIAQDFAHKNQARRAAQRLANIYKTKVG